MFKYSENKKLIYRGILLLLLLILCIAASYAWLSRLSSSKDFEYNKKTGSVDYSFNNTSAETFFAYFDTDNSEDYKDDDVVIENGHYIRASSLSIIPRDISKFYVSGFVQASGTYKVGKTYYTDITGTTQVDTSNFTSATDVSSYFVKTYIHPKGEYKSDTAYFLDNEGTIRFNVTPTEFNIFQGLGINLSYLFVPKNSTDTVLWESSLPQNITVSKYGRIFAVGDVGSSSIIKGTSKDRNPAGTRVDTSSFIAGVTSVAEYYTANYINAVGYFINTQTYFYNQSGSEQVDTTGFVLNVTPVSQYYIFNGLGYVKAHGLYDNTVIYYYNDKGSPLVDTSLFTSTTPISSYYILSDYVKAGGTYVPGKIYFYGDVSNTVTVNILEKPAQGGKIYNYLPTQTEILKTSVIVNNLSSVNSKLRLKVSWAYSDFDEGFSSENNRTVYLTEQLFAGYKGPQIVYSATPISPIVLTFSKNANNNSLWNNTKSNGYLIFIDAQGVEWSITSLSLTPTEYYNIRKFYGLITDSNPMPTVFNFATIMFDKAESYFYYGSFTSMPDYGDTITPPQSPETKSIPVLTSIMTTQNYTAYSTRNIFTLTLTLQGRQSDYFVMGTNGNKDGWFDVATLTNP